MSQGGSLAASPSTLWRPPKFLVEKALQEKRNEREAPMEKLEVNDVEFKDDHMEVVRLVRNPHQLSRSRVNPF